MEHSPTASSVSDAFIRRFEARVEAAGGAMSFASFMDLALYDVEVGYYRAVRTRVGRAGGTDFYTASTFGGVFGTLVVGAAETLLAGGDVEDHEFVEIGAEPGRSVLDGVAHKFRAVRTIRVGDPLDLRGACVVFSNELFDAQPFHRVAYRGGSWVEMGVMLTAGQLAWTPLPAWSPAVAGMAHHLPAAAEEGYVLDLPLAAEALARRIAAPGWHGVFLAVDYGRPWAQLITEYPAGTGRAYANHRQSGDLLAQPGAQDLTCHVCWDWLAAALREGGFDEPMRESQEAFFVRRAEAAIHGIVASDSNPLAPRRTRLRHLLHPALMGQRFEALWAVRHSAAIPG